MKRARTYFSTHKRMATTAAALLILMIGIASLASLAVAADPVSFITVLPSANGTVTVSPDPVLSGDNATCTITPNSGHHFVSFGVDGETTTTVAGAVAGTRSYIFTSVTASHSVNATFAIDTFKVGVGPSTNCTISPNTTETVNWNSNSSTYTITPDTGYHFVSATDNSVVVTTTVPGSVAGTREYVVKNVVADHTIAAASAINTYTLTYNHGVGGSVVGTSPQTVDYGSSGTTVTATAVAPYHFVKWSDNNSTVAARRETSVTASLDTTATFGLDTYTIVPTAGPNGAISPSTVQTVEHGSSSETFTITPASGYHLVAATDGTATLTTVDGVVAGTKQYRFTNVTANHEIAVTFALDAPADPGNVTFARVTGGTLIQWTTAANATGYQIFLNGALVGTGGATTTSLFLGQYIGPKTIVSVQAVGTGGSSPWVTAIYAGGSEVKLGSFKFSGNSTKLTTAMKRTLRGYASTVAAQGFSSLRIDGYTATGGTYAGRKKVSLARAKAVKAYLDSQFKSRGAAVGISAVGKGSANPVGSNKSKSGRAKNQRVEVIIR